MKAITPKQLHDWYLEAIKDLEDEYYNKKAKKDFDELTPEQKFIDEFISDRINEYIRMNTTINIEFDGTELDKS